MDLLISSPRLGAHDAQAMGLVKRVVPPGDLLAHSLAYAGDLAARMSPRSVAVMKAQVWHASLGSFDDALRSALAETTLSFGHPDSAEGAASHRERRAPRFADL